jgi:hypothetical protein
MKNTIIKEITKTVYFYFSWGYFYFSAGRFSCKKIYRFSLIDELNNITKIPDCAGA